MKEILLLLLWWWICCWLDLLWCGFVVGWICGGVAATMNGGAGFDGDVARMVVVFLWYGRWWWIIVGVVWVCLKMGKLGL